MRPISRAAMNATASARVTDLATPKKNFQLDSPQKCSRWVKNLYPAGKKLFQFINQETWSVKNPRMWSFSRCLFLLIMIEYGYLQAITEILEMREQINST